MKKRILGLLLVMCMVIAMVPMVSAASTNYNIWVGGVQITSDNASNVLGNGTVMFEESTNTLTLNNATIDETVGDYNLHPIFVYAFSIFSEQSLSINLIGENKVGPQSTTNASRSCGIYVYGGTELTISGSGSLVAESGVATVDGISAGIASNVPITIDGCSVTCISNGTQNMSYGVFEWVNSGVTVKNGARLVSYGTDEIVGRGHSTNHGGGKIFVYDTSEVILKGNKGATDGFIVLQDQDKSVVLGSQEYDGSNKKPITNSYATYKYIEARKREPLTKDLFVFYSPNNLIYDGAAKFPSLISEVYTGIPTKNYYKDGAEVSYPKDVGTYKVEIDAPKSGIYAAVKGLTDDNWTFTIEPLDISSGATVGSFSHLSYNGSEQTPYAPVTINGLTVTGTWSKVTSVSDKTTFTANGNFTGTISDKSTGMAKGIPSHTAPTGLTATYGQTLADITLPSGFAWTAPTINVGSVGTNTFTASYTPTDTENYNTVTNINITVAVSATNITFSIGEITSVTYNGTAHTPTVVVKDGAATLTANDYTVSYNNNTNAGTATVTVTGKGNYAGSNGTKLFTINPLDITGATVGAFGSLTYNGAVQTPSATVTKGGLTATGIWSAVTNVSDKTSFTANGNFTGIISDKSTGMAKGMPSHTAPTGLTATYGQTLADITLPSGFAWTAPTINVGSVGTNTFTASYTPTDTENYNTVTNINITVAVSAKQITFSMGEIAAVTYNGTAHTPAVVVKDGAATLTNTDYTVSYNNNTNAGTATVTVTGKGNYAGSNSIKTFTINHADVTNGKNDQTVTYAGQTYDASQLFTLNSNAGTPSYTIEAGGTGNGTLSGNILTITKAGTVVVGMTTEQTANYNAGGKLLATLTINRGTQDSPSGIIKLNASIKGGNDGKIQNVSLDMEYKIDGGEYTDVTGSEIPELTKGDYFIRFKETALYNAGLDTQITINEPAVIKADETVPDGIVLETPTQSGDSLDIKVTKASAVAPKITALSGSKLMAIVFDITAEINSTPAATLPHLVKIILPIPEAAKGRSITVYRLHEGTATEMPAGEANKNVDGEYIVIGTDTIVIYAKNFSQYAIAYKKPSSSGGSSTTPLYKITVIQSAGGEISPDTVSVIKNSSKKFTITPNDGYEIEDVLVDAKSVGAVKEYTFEKVTSAASITAKFKKIEEKPDEHTKPTEPANPPKWQNPFTDVNENDWFYEAVKYVTENGLMNGTDNTIFAPNMNVTRAMFVTVLYRAEKQPNAGISSFADIESGVYYEKAVAWAAANGIVKGISETKFAPSDTISREQMAAIIHRYAAFKDFDTAISEATSYADSSNISDYAKESVAFCSENGIMSGKGSNTFAPQEYATRAEVATVLERVLKILQ